MSELAVHIIRIHPNLDGSGLRWWAEDDNGFTGGADRLEDLVATIREYAEAEGITEQLAMRLAMPEPDPPIVSLAYSKDASIPVSSRDGQPKQVASFQPA